jgi:hypothetical protein
MGDKVRLVSGDGHTVVERISRSCAPRGRNGDWLQRERTAVHHYSVVSVPYDVVVSSEMPLARQLGDHCRHGCQP